MKIALIGYGKMGRAIETIALQKGHEVVLKVTHENSNDLSAEMLKKADVALEFSTPEAAFQNVMKCIEAGVPVVSGTTGWNDKLDEAKAICNEKKGAFFYASNFSIGVNIFFEINKHLAALMNHFEEYYNIAIGETHHVHKKDKPSGTAITIAEQILENVKRLKGWRLVQEGQTMFREGTLPISSFRIGDVPGEHQVRYNSDDDGIYIIHNANNRDGFAKGAILAAEWLVGRQGVFTMSDLLHF